MRLKITAILLIGLILSLSILDAPEYIRCIHVDLCEFLELHSHLEDIIKSDAMRHITSIAAINFFSVLEDLTNSKELMKNLIFFFIPVILTFLKFSSISIKRKSIDLVKTEYPSFLIKNTMILEILKLVEVSIIRS